MNQQEQYNPYRDAEDDQAWLTTLHDRQYDVNSLYKFKKNFYTEHPEVSKLTNKEVDKLREDGDMKVFGQNVPKPTTSFDNSGLPDYILNTLKNVGFQKPTPIQSQCWPILLSGHDIIGLAETGSGKTLAFLLPSIVHLKDQPNIQSSECSPICVVLAPTRELAMQITKECKRFTDEQSVNVGVMAVYGGVNRDQQVRQWKTSLPDIIVATPGRLIDLLTNFQPINLSRVTYLVLDEADRMLDMGFEPQIRKIIGQIRPDRQTSMFSATWNKDVQSLAYDFLNDPLIVNIGSIETAANHRVAQRFMFMDYSSKPSKLIELVNKTCDGRKVLIFCGARKTTDDVCEALRKDGWPALSIHGQKSQKERDWVMQQFRQGIQPLLVATDVAARGLDIYDIQLVINYDMPNDIDAYVHRIGRTARAGKYGCAISFFTPDDSGIARKLKGILEEANQPIPTEIDAIGGGSSYQQKRGYSNYNRPRGSGGRYGNNNSNSYNNNGNNYNYNNNDYGDDQPQRKKFKRE